MNQKNHYPARRPAKAGGEVNCHRLTGGELLEHEK